MAPEKAIDLHRVGARRGRDAGSGRADRRAAFAQKPSRIRPADDFELVVITHTVTRSLNDPVGICYSSLKRAPYPAPISLDEPGPPAPAERDAVASAEV